MAATAGGWPYPVGTDKVVDGDNAIKAVADVAELRLGNMRVYAAEIACSPLDSNGDFIFNYPKPFVAVPVVQLTPAETSPPFHPAVMRDYSNAAGVRIRIKNYAGAPITTGGVYVFLTAVGRAV